MKINTLYNYIKFKILERRKFGVRYLFFNNNSDSLIIVFSAFPPTNKRVYNYVNGFSKLNKIDRLYIGDYWGYKGSYYLLEKGHNKPYESTCKLIKDKINRGGYKKIYTAGSSKGGSSAIIFGLKFHANHIFSGACQYYIGSYLFQANKNILYAMMSDVEKDLNGIVAKLDAVMPSIISRSDKSSTIHIIYSKKDHTYYEHIVDLIKNLRANGFCVVEIEEFFDKHDDVGIPFKKYVVDFLNNKNNL